MEDETNEDNLSLEYESENLTESAENLSDDFEFEPPEENKAKKLNVNNIFLVILISVLLVISLIFFVSKFTKTKKKESAELEKAGTKFIPNIEISKKDVPFDFSDDDDEYLDEP